MEVAVGYCYVVGDYHALADCDLLGAHEDGPYENAVVADHQLPGRLNVESRPCVNLHSISEHKAEITTAPISLETVLALDETACPQFHVRREIRKIPPAG